MFDTFQVETSDFEVIDLYGFDKGVIIDRVTKNPYMYYKISNPIEGLNQVYVVHNKVKVQFSQKILKDYPRSIEVSDIKYIEDVINSLGSVNIKSLMDSDLNRVDYVSSINTKDKEKCLLEYSIRNKGRCVKKLYKSSLVVDSRPRITIYDKLVESKDCNEATKLFYKDKLRVEYQIRGQRELKKFVNTEIKKSVKKRTFNSKKISVAYSDKVKVKDLVSLDLNKLEKYFDSLFSEDKILIDYNDLSLSNIIKELGKERLVEIFGDDVKSFIKCRIKDKRKYRNYLPKYVFKKLI